MSCDAYSEKLVKTRKAHICKFCGLVNPAGTMMYRCTGIFEHEPFTRYECECCRRVTNAFWDYADGEALLPEDFYCFISEAYSLFKAYPEAKSLLGVPRDEVFYQAKMLGMLEDE